MIEDTRLTAAPPPVAGLDGDCVTGSWTGPSAVGGGDACPSVGGQRPPPVVVGDILQQAIAEVSNDRSGSVFSGEAAAALESGVLGIVGSVAPELLTMANVKILTTDRLFYSENEAAFSYLMEAESGVEKPGISKQLLDCATADCVQKMDEGEGVVSGFPAEFSEPEKFADEGQRLATLIDTTGGIVEPVPAEPTSAEDENLALVENRIEIENGAPKFQLRLPSKDGAKSAPLGSSQNPIRLVQQGNRYKSLQNLSPEQLAQIMQVVQQQQLIRSSKETGQASVLYNPQTQTKIIFRVVNPSEIQKRATGAARIVKLSAKSGAGTAVLHGRKKTPYKKKLLTEPREAVQEIRKEVKGQKKAQRRRTRYGRLSRPPQYMVSDYRRINRVDFAEDDEDSEGEYGYSDFQGDDSENERTKSKNTKSVYINADNSDSGCLKPKKHQCRTCEKNYIGFKGLARHLRLNPSHDAGNSSSDFGTPSVSAADSKDSVKSSARDSSRADNLNESSDSNPENSRDLTAEDATVPAGESLGVRTRGRPRPSVSRAKPTSHPDKSSTSDLSHDPPKRKRGRPPASARSKSRRDKLQEMVDQCTDEELMNVFLPRLRSSVSVFDFLLLKTTDDNSRPDLKSMLSEFEEFHRLVGTTFQENLVPVVRPGKTANEGGNRDEMERPAEESTTPTSQDSISEKSVIEICDGDFACCLGLSPGSYELREDSPLLSHKLFAPIPVAAPESPIQPSSHVDEMVSQGQVATLPLRKRLRLTENAGTATKVTSPAMDRSDGGCDTLSSGQTMLPTTAAVENMLPVGDLEAGGDAMLSGSVVKVKNTSGGVDNPEKNDFGAGLSLRVSGSSDDAGYVVSGVAVLAEDGQNGAKNEEVRGSGAVVDVPMDSEPVSVGLASCRLPFQSSNFLGAYLPHGSQTPDGFAKEREVPLANSYYGNEADRLVDRTPAAATTFTSAELQPVNAGDLMSCDKTYPSLVASTEPSSACRDVLAGIGYGVPGPAASQALGQFVSSEAAPMERNFLTLPGQEFVLVSSGTTVERHAQGGGAGEIANGQQEMQVDAGGAAVMPTTRDLVIVQNPDGSFMIHGQPGQDIPLEMVQTLIGLEQGGPVIFSDAQPGYVVENWNPLK